MLKIIESAWPTEIVVSTQRMIENMWDELIFGLLYSADDAQTLNEPGLKLFFVCNGMPWSKLSLCGYYDLCGLAKLLEKARTFHCPFSLHFCLRSQQ